MFCTLIYLLSKSTSFHPPPPRNNQDATLKKLKALLQVIRKATLSLLLLLLKILYLYHASLFKEVNIPLYPAYQVHLGYQALTDGTAVTGRKVTKECQEITV